MHTTLRFRCPNCDTKLSATEDFAGLTCHCPTCETTFPIPTANALVPVNPQALVPEVLHDEPAPGRMVRRRKRRKSSMTPVELHLPGQLGGMKVNVDRKTSNAMATTFLGGVLVAIGAALFSIFGGKHKA